MKRRSQLFFILAFSLLAQASAQAGAESHGGQVVFCPGQEPVMLDYYQATLATEAGGIPTLVDTSKMSSQDVLDLIKKRLSGTVLWDRYSRALEVLGPVDSWLEVDTQPVFDSDPAYSLPPGCSLGQLAVRQDTTMYVDTKILKQISPAQQGILMAHEALYFVGQNYGLTSSVEVRMVIRNLLLKNEDEIALCKAVHELGSNFFYWEWFVNFQYTEPSKKIVDFRLSYDPLLDGENFNYTMGYDPDPGTPHNTVIDSGKFRCEGESVCHTVSGPHNCILTNIVWMSNGAAQMLLACSDINFSAVITAVTK